MKPLSIAQRLIDKSYISFQKEERARRKAMTPKQRERLRLKTLQRAGVANSAKPRS